MPEFIKQLIYLNRAGTGCSLAKRNLISLMLASALGWLATPAYARDWTGAVSANWSDPNNWSPVGTPQTGEFLEFGAVADSHTSMVNDIVGLTLDHIWFADHDHELSGNPLTLSNPYSTLANVHLFVVGDPSFTTTINCPLVLPNGGEINTGSGPGSFTESTEDFYLNGEIMVNVGKLTLGAHSVDAGGGGNGHMHIAAVISGNADVLAVAEDAGGHISTISFDGAANTFSGTLYLTTTGNAQVNFNKSSGVVVSNRLAVIDGDMANLNLAGPNQIGSDATIEIDAGSQLLLSGNNVTVRSLVFSNYSADAASSTLDTGSTLVGLNGGITASVNNDHVHPMIKGQLNLNGFLPFDISGGPQPGLDIQATIEGNGFQKLGDGTLRLNGNNTFFGDAEISAGTVEAYTSTAFGQAGPTYGVELDGGNLVLQGVAIGAEPLFVNSAVSFLTAINQCSWAGPVTLNADLNVIPVDATFSGLKMNFSGPISGSGGLNLQPALFGVGNVQLSGPDGNLFTGPTTVNCQLLEFNKYSGVNAYAGPLIVGGAAGSALHEARWLNSYQNVGATLTLYANGLVNLTNNNEDFGPVTFNGGTVDSGPGGHFVIYQPLTVNPADTTAVINGNFGLAAGADRVLNVNDGAADPDLQVNAVVYGNPGTYFVKQGAGTMALAGINTFNAPTLLEEGIVDINNAQGLGTWPGLIIFDGATLRISGGINTGGGVELLGSGVGGTHGAIEVLPGNSFGTSGNVLMDGATTFNTGTGAVLGLNGLVWSTGLNAAPLIKTGAGALIMAGGANNTYSGDTRVSAGSLLLAKSANKICVPGNLIIGPGPAGPTTFARLIYSGEMGGTTVTVNGNSLFDLNGNNAILIQLTLNDGGSVQTGAGTLSLADGSSVNIGSLSAFGSHVASTITGKISLPIGSATFNVSPPAPSPPLLLGPTLDIPATISGGSSGQLTVVSKYGLGQMQWDGNNTYLNQTRIYEGTLIAANAGALGSSSGATYVYNSASLALNGVSITGEYVVLDSTNNAALDSRGSADGWGGTIYLNRNSSISVNNSLTASSVIDGPGSLIKTGPGSLTLSGGGNNTFAGEAFVNQGTLLLSKPAAVTAIPGPVEVGAVDGSSAGTLRNLTSYQIVGNIYVHSEGLYDVNGQQENVDYLGLDGNGVVQTGVGYLSLKTGGSIAVTPGVNTTATINDHLYLDPGNHVITVASGGTAPGANDLVVNAAISQSSTAASIQKEGAGRLRFTAANTYSGSTTINAGTLQVDGSQPQSPVSVNGGTLQGRGTVGPISLTASTATVAPGGSPGILTCGDFDSSGGNGILSVELNGTTPGTGYDQLNVGGTVNLTGVSLNASLGYASSTSDQFTIINNDGSDPVTGTFTGLQQGKKLYIGKELFQIAYTGGSGNDVVLTRLTTPPLPTLTIQSVPPASVRLVWPTNDPPFGLQSSTDLVAANWLPALPLPVVIGTNNIVTNSADGIARFFRLSNP